jgi:hypothetical protein
MQRHFLGHFGLARPSLLLLGVSMLSGCLVEDPPVYTKPTQTPPRLDLRRATPPPDKIIVAIPGDRIPFHLPFASEDVGDQVRGYLFLDYDPDPDKSNIALDSISVPGSTLDDPAERSLNLTYPRVGDDTLGCHRITIRVSHEQNFVRFPYAAVIDNDDVAEAYWWMNVIDIASGDDGSTLKNCPAAVGGMR